MGFYVWLFCDIVPTMNMTWRIVHISLL